MKKQKQELYELSIEIFVFIIIIIFVGGIIMGFGIVTFNIGGFQQANGLMYEKDCNPKFNLSSCFKEVTISGNSMYPTFKDGDKININFCLKGIINVSELKIGDIISFNTPTKNGLELYIHRIIKINYEDSCVVTKGDNNPNPDGCINAIQINGIYEEKPIKNCIVSNTSFFTLCSGGCYVKGECGNEE